MFVLFVVVDAEFFYKNTSKNRNRTRSVTKLEAYRLEMLLASHDEMEQISSKRGGCIANGNKRISASQPHGEDSDLVFYEKLNTSLDLSTAKVLGSPSLGALSN